MKKILAALTAITIAAGLSLAAVVAPASADVAPATTPAPAASTTPSDTPSTAPSTAPSVAPSTAPAAPAPAAPATDTTGTVPPVTFAASTATQNFSPTTPSVSYVTVVWSEPTWVSTTHATYPQTFISQTPEATETLSVTIPDTCGTQYQVDSYVASTALNSFLAYYSSDPVHHKLAGPDGAQDGNYLAGGGRDHAYKLVQNPGCPPPCIPDSSVFYTYSNNDSNSGDITVPTVQGSSGQLCTPFYVTATSWKYTTNGVWPQVVDVVDHVNGSPVGGSNIAISASGTYHYAAQITCGQGDIYASFTSNGATLFPENDNLPGTGYLAGPGNPLPEHFLHNMGFTGPNPTYHQDNTNCWTPTPETGVPTTTTLTCAKDSANTLTLPAVPGGVWKVTNGTGGNHYTFTYPIGTGVTNWVPTNFNGQYTITLTDGNSNDGYDVTGTSTTWNPQNPDRLDCRTIVTPETPTAVAITQCGVDGSIWIPDTTGVQYYLDGNAVSAGTISGLHGPHTITAKEIHGYKFSHDAQKEWDFKLHAEKTCPVSITVGQCTADGAVSSVPVSVFLDNSSGSVSSSFTVTAGGDTYNFTVGAHSTATEQVGTSGTAGEEVDVYINGSETPVVLTVDKFVGCQITVVPADPTVTQQTCNVATGVLSNDASITVDEEAGLSYSITGPGGYTLNNIVGTGGKTVVATGLVHGDYVVTVAALPGYILDPSLSGNGSKWPFTISLAQTTCFQVAVSVTPADCPNLNVGSSQFTATTTGVPSITITPNSNVVYTAYLNGASSGTVLTAATTDVSPGSWVVKATLSPSAPSYLSLPGGVVSFGSFDLNAFCPPPLATWHAGATGSNAVCTNGTTTDGVITLTHNNPDETGKITYTITRTDTNAVVYTGNLDNTVNVPAGSYSVKATPPAGDGISGNSQILPGGAEIFPTITIGLNSSNCDTSRLAFTGGTIAWLGFVLAGGMLFLGIAFLLIRRRQQGIAE